MISSSYYTSVLINYNPHYSISMNVVDDSDGATATQPSQPHENKPDREDGE